MEQIELVVRMPKVEYEYIKKHMDEPQFKGMIFSAIANSTPLPKGHGRLIDADKISYNHAIARNIEDGHNWNELVATKDEITDLPTIIEADKEGAEE